jgi:hypothetical protein
MSFIHNGQTYDSSQVEAFHWLDPQIGAVYLTQQRDAVFVAINDDWRGVCVHQADANEIKFLATRFTLPQLLAAI